MKKVLIMIVSLFMVVGCSCSNDKAADAVEKYLNDYKGLNDHVLEDIDELVENENLTDKGKEIYREGGVIGGTSAGAAVMSKIMLTGEEKNVPERREGDFSYIKRGTVQTAEGFGFVESAIIDQHFIIRKRENRLLSLVLQHPDLVGIGIDEATAIIVNPDHSFKVAGQSQVMVFEPKAPVTTTVDGYMKTGSLNIRILTAGDTYQLK